MSTTTIRCSFSHNTFPVVAEIQKRTIGESSASIGKVCVCLRVYRADESDSPVSRPLPASTPIDFTPFEFPDEVQYAMEGIGGVGALRHTSKLVEGLPKGSVEFHHMASPDFVWFTPYAWERLGMRTVKETLTSRCVSTSGKRTAAAAVIFPCVDENEIARLKTMRCAVESTGVIDELRMFLRFLPQPVTAPKLSSTTPVSMERFLELRNAGAWFTQVEYVAGHVVQILPKTKEFAQWRKACEMAEDLFESRLIFASYGEDHDFPAFQDEEEEADQHFERCLALAKTRGISKLAVASNGRFYYATPSPTTKNEVVIGHKEFLKNFWTDAELETEVERFREMRMKENSAFAKHMRSFCAESGMESVSKSLKFAETVMRTLGEIDYVCACAGFTPMKSTFRNERLERFLMQRSFLVDDEKESEANDADLRFIAYCDTEPDRTTSTMRKHMTALNHAVSILKGGKALAFVENELQCTSVEKVVSEGARIRKTAKMTGCEIVQL